jgi:predicted ATPase
LLGRGTELADLAGLLDRDSTRLVTLTGPGGTGKTRLALQAAADALDFPGGVFLVALAATTDPGLVVPAIARTLGIREGAGRTVDQALRDFLGDRRLLLLLDNFEQVVQAAPGVAGLLAERAQAVKPGFQVTNDNAPAVAEICIRLDGLPLAIELAGARTRLLSPQAVLARLGQRLRLRAVGPRGVPARQQTLRAAIDWSYDLLTEPEGRLFAHLAVFVGGRDLEAAEVVGDEGGAMTPEEAAAYALDRPSGSGGGGDPEHRP